MGEPKGSIPACTGKPVAPARIVLEVPVYPRVYGETHKGDKRACQVVGLSPRVRGNRVLPAVLVAVIRSIPACTGKPSTGGGPALASSVYPRVYGETCMGGSRWALWGGLSPRVRGNRIGLVGTSCSNGSIPACTGKPRQPPPHPRHPEVYPRVYGETHHRIPNTHHTIGLSPRVRGNRTPRLAMPTPLRSIPACTGKPKPASAPANPSPVYPRVYGETSPTTTSPCPSGGLSPRVRGNPLPSHHPNQAPRSIPACTGKPKPASAPANPSPVYPRVYGETSPTTTSPCPSGGLSPRVRGNPLPSHHPNQAPRSIPACTGKPTYCPTYSWAKSVYPRVYGETRAPVLPRPFVSGLSPRVRGNRFPLVIYHVEGGSIPACTGKPTCMSPPRAMNTVYPRVYGETAFEREYGMPLTGLSPRVRGNRAVREPGRSKDRSIPACTGKPATRR